MRRLIVNGLAAVLAGLEAGRASGTYPSPGMLNNVVDKGRPQNCCHLKYGDPNENSSM